MADSLLPIRGNGKNEFCFYLLDFYPFILPMYYALLFLLFLMQIFRNIGMQRMITVLMFSFIRSFYYSGIYGQSSATKKTFSFLDKIYFKSRVFLPILLFYHTTHSNYYRSRNSCPGASIIFIR